jgi:hypothetical protein
MQYLSDEIEINGGKIYGDAFEHLRQTFRERDGLVLGNFIDIQVTLEMVFSMLDYSSISANRSFFRAKPLSLHLCGKYPNFPSKETKETCA